MQFRNICNEFKTLMKNVTGIKFDVVAINNITHIMIGTTSVYAFRADSLDEFQVKLDAYKCYVVEKYLNYMHNHRALMH